MLIDFWKFSMLRKLHVTYFRQKNIEIAPGPSKTISGVWSSVCMTKQVAVLARISVNKDNSSGKLAIDVRDVVHLHNSDIGMGKGAACHQKMKHMMWEPISFQIYASFNVQAIEFPSS